MKQNYDVIETAKRNGGFEVFTGALADAGLEEALKEMGPYTLFAPTNEAFAKIPRKKLDDLLKPEKRETLQALLRNHIVPGKLTANELKTLSETKSAKGEELKIESREGLWINQARVVSPDLEASNGVLHGIDSVLMPQTQVATAG
ncbi:MAG TPA: fasciclin domain-containing protein [Pyrinomonadaceae bacterium]|nr:fasciclin domain-containing protein [Pyrinomonadaceae bacterium]